MGVDVPCNVKPYGFLIFSWNPTGFSRPFSLHLVYEPFSPWGSCLYQTSGCFSTLTKKCLATEEETSLYPQGSFGWSNNYMYTRQINKRNEYICTYGNPTYMRETPINESLRNRKLKWCVHSILSGGGGKGPGGFRWSLQDKKKSRCSVMSRLPCQTAYYGQGP